MGGAPFRDLPLSERKEAIPLTLLKVLTFGVFQHRTSSMKSFEDERFVLLFGENSI